MTFTAQDARVLVRNLTELSVPVPQPVTRAIEIVENIAATLEYRTPTGILNLNDDDITQAIRTEAHHQDSNRYWTPATFSITQQVWADLEQALHDGLHETIVTALQKPFAKAAAALHAAARHGYTARSTADDALNQNDPDAVKVWQAIAPATDDLDNILKVRATLCRALDLAPTVPLIMALNNWDRLINPIPQQVPDWTVLIAADTWSSDGTLNTNQRLGNSPDWLRIAQDGLHLNTIDEVNQKIAARQHALTPPDAAADTHPDNTPQARRERLRRS